jgi:hypothetical protein
MAEVNKSIDVKVGARFDDFKKTGLPDVIKQQIEPLTGQLTTINEALGQLVAGNKGTPPPAGSEGKTTVDPAMNAQLSQLTQLVKTQGAQLEQLKVAKADAEHRAEETDRFSTIRGSLTSLPFVNDAAADTAFKIVSPHVRRLEDQTLVAGVNGDVLPVPAFVKDYLEKDHAYLFKTSGSSGSGATSQPGASSIRYGAKVNTDSIKVGMSAETRQAAVDAIKEAMASV